MRTWDINPGYLSRTRLLGEHAELHNIVSVVCHHKKDFANHPETRRWRDYGWALSQRHKLLLAEMQLRGYRHQSPLGRWARFGEWPPLFLDSPVRQYQILAEKYRGMESGRIPLPDGNLQRLWAQHKYSVMARDPVLYHDTGRRVAANRGRRNFASLASDLTEILRQPPSASGLRNALQHMWGYVSGGQIDPVDPDRCALSALLTEIQLRTQQKAVVYLWNSTALSELQAWL